MGFELIFERNTAIPLARVNTAILAAQYISGIPHHLVDILNLPPEPCYTYHLSSLLSNQKMHHWLNITCAPRTTMDTCSGNSRSVRYQSMTSILTDMAKMSRATRGNHGHITIVLQGTISSMSFEIHRYPSCISIRVVRVYMCTQTLTLSHPQSK